MKKIGLLFLLFALLIPVGGQAKKEKTVLPLPTPAQLVWQDAELVAVFHYDLHVFDGVRYNQAYNRITPIPDINIFNPEQLDTDQWIRSVKAMGAKIIGASEQSHSVQGMQDTPIFGHKYVMNDEEWDTFCTGMNKLGKIAKEEYGISLTFHHHMGTVVQNPDEVERMMENTDSEYVSLLFDTGHFTYCGADPLEMVKKYVSRIKHVHLKDIRPEVVEKVKNENLSFLEGVRLGTFTVPGDGCIDFDPIFKVLEDAGYEGYMLVEAEQDPAKANPLEYAIKARKFIAEKTGL